MSSHQDQTQPPMNMLLEGTAGPTRGEVQIRVSVDRTRCHLYGICDQEAPEVFALTADDRLEYNGVPNTEQLQAVRQAARVCPMQAIWIKEKWR